MSLPTFLTNIVNNQGLNSLNLALPSAPVPGKNNSNIDSYQMNLTMVNVTGTQKGPVNASFSLTDTVTGAPVPVSSLGYTFDNAVTVPQLITSNGSGFDAAGNLLAGSASIQASTGTATVGALTVGTTLSGFSSAGNLTVGGKDVISASDGTATLAALNIGTTGSGFDSAGNLLLGPKTNGIANLMISLTDPVTKTTSNYNLAQVIQQIWNVLAVADGLKLH